MMLMIHIAIALSSLIFSTFLFVSPSKNKLYVSYALVISTLVTGTYLVASSGGHIIQACMMGILYLGLVSFGIVFAERTLAKERAKR